METIKKRDYSHEYKLRIQKNLRLNFEIKKDLGELLKKHLAENNLSLVQWITSQINKDIKGEK